EHPVLAEQGDEEGQGCDQVGRVVKQQLSLGQVLVDEEVLPLLQVAQAAVYQLGGLGGRPRGQVGAVHEACAQAPGGRVEGHARAAWRGVAPEVCYPVSGAAAGVAKAMCAECGVRGTCLGDALANREREGVWGGATERERRRMTGQRRKSAWASRSRRVSPP